jgi:hypothetical protein
VQVLAFGHQGASGFEGGGLPLGLLRSAKVEKLGKKGFPGLGELLKLGEVAVP